MSIAFCHNVKQFNRACIAFIIMACFVVAASKAKADGPADEMLMQLAQKKFPSDISPGETDLFRAAASGKRADFRATNETDPANAATWSTNRVIRADRLIWLCTDSEASKLVTFRGIQISGARIDGIVNLASANIAFPLSMRHGAFTRNLNLTGSHLPSLDLGGTRIQSLEAEGMEVKGSVILNGGFDAEGVVDIYDSSIEGDLECSGGSFNNRGISRIALKAGRIKVLGRVSFGNGFKALGMVRLIGATINGDLDCSGGQFLDSNTNDSALIVERTKITGRVELGAGFVADGRVDFTGATIGESFNCSGGHFQNFNADEYVLVVQGAKIDGTVLLGPGFIADGGVAFTGATIGGFMNCSGGQFNGNEHTAALLADEAKIGSSVILNRPFKARGLVSFYGATIGGDLNCSSGQLIHQGTNQICLSARSARIDGSVSFGDESHQCSLAGRLDFVNSSIARNFIWAGVKSPANAILDLRYAKINMLLDNARSWPSKSNLFLEGFIYDQISPHATTDVASRITWLHLQPDDPFESQPYTQLAAVFRNMGQEDKVADVMIAKNKDYAARLQWSKPGQWSECFWYKIFGYFIGYGYKSGRAFELSLVFIVVGTFIFHLGHRYNLMLPREEKACSFTGGVLKVNKSYPVFNSFIYSLEMFVPLVKLGIDDHWRPSAERGHPLFHARKKTLLTTDGLLRCYLWIHIIAGWVLTTLWVGGLTGLVKT